MIDDCSQASGRRIRLSTNPFFLFSILLFACGNVAIAQSVFEYKLPTSWDGVSSTVTDLSVASNNASLSGTPALSSTIPPGATTGTQSLSSANGGFHTLNTNLLSNTIVEANGGYYYEVYFYWDGTATTYITQKLIDYAGTESLHLQNINTGAGTADLLFGFDDPVEGPIQSINANTWYHVLAVFDTQGNVIDGSGNLAGLATLSADGVSTSASVTKTTQGDNLNRPIGVGTLPSGTGLVNFNGYLYHPTVTLGLPLIGHWKMDDGGGTTAADSTTFGNNANLFGGATWTSDCVGNGAIEFDGNGDYATTGQSFSPPSAGAVAFWMRGSGPLSARQRLFGVNGNWEVRQETNGTLSFDLGASPYVGNEPFSTLTAVDEKDRWYHIVAIFDDTDDSFSVYVDGELRTSGTSPVNLVPQAAGPLSFGTRTGSSEYWEGALRDFRVYARSLTNAEIASLSGVIAHWRLDESSGTVAFDSSVDSNDATYVSAPTLGVNGAFPAKTNTAVELDGSSDSITAGTSLLNNLTEFSLAGWVRPNDTTPDKSFFGQNGLIELGIDSQTNQIDLWTSAGGSLSVSVQLPFGKWTHVVAVGDGTQLNLYVNGVEIASGGSATTNYGSNSNPFKIGEGVFDTSGGYFDGRIDDVRVYSRVLCPEEVNGVYKGGRPAGVRILQWLETR